MIGAIRKGACRRIVPGKALQPGRDGGLWQARQDALTGAVQLVMGSEVGGQFATRHLPQPALGPTLHVGP